jgi:hypothetical protein
MNCRSWPNLNKHLKENFDLKPVQSTWGFRELIYLKDGFPVSKIKPYGSANICPYTLWPHVIFMGPGLRNQGSRYHYTLGNGILCRFSEKLCNLKRLVIWFLCNWLVPNDNIWYQFSFHLLKSFPNMESSALQVFFFQFCICSVRNIYILN